MVEQSPNHGFEVGYEEGDEPWEYNAEFEALEELVPVRDEEAQLGQYEPHDGARFVSTDTGAVFEGDGTAWVFGTRDFAELYEDGDRIATRDWVDAEVDDELPDEVTFDQVTFEDAGVSGGDSLDAFWDDSVGFFLSPTVDGVSQDALRYRKANRDWIFDAEFRADGLRSYELTRFYDQVNVYEGEFDDDFLGFGWTGRGPYMSANIDGNWAALIEYNTSGGYWESDVEFRIDDDPVAIDGDAQPPEVHGNEAHDSDFAYDGATQPPEDHDNDAHSVTFVETNETDLEIQVDGTDGPGVLNFKTGN